MSLEETDRTQWLSGKINFYDSEKGFGFINCWEDNNDYFFHISKVKSKEIIATDFVVFKLKKSKKKEGTFEAYNLYKLTEFEVDYQYLKKIFISNENENIQKILLPKIQINDIYEFVVGNLDCVFENIEKLQKYLHKLKKRIILVENNLNEAVISELFEKHLNRFESNINYNKIEAVLWLEGIIKKGPNILNLSNLFNNSNEDLKLKILNKSSLETKIQIIQNYCETEIPLNVFEFITRYLTKTYKISEYDILKNLTNKEFWSDKDEYVIIEIINNYYSNKLNDEEKFPLFIKGYISNISTSFLINRFNIADKNNKILILRNCSLDTKKEIIKLYSKEENAITVMGFIVEYLTSFYSNHYITFDKFKNTEYWEDKEEYILYSNSIEYYLENADNYNKIQLFLNNYTNQYSLISIVENIDNLTDESLCVILSKLTENEILTVTHKKIETLINQLKQNLNNDNEEILQIYEHYASRFSYILRRIYEKQNTEINRVIKNEISSNAPYLLVYKLWREKLLETPSIECISTILNEHYSNNISKEIDFWLSKNLIPKDYLIDLLLKDIKSQPKIANRNDYYYLNDRLLYLKKLLFDFNSSKDIVPSYNISFFQLSCWFNDISNDFNYEVFKSIFVYLSNEHQIKFLRKIFKLAHLNLFDLTIDKLDQLVRIDFDLYLLSESYHPDLPLDISVDIVIQALKSFKKNSKFLLESELLKIFLTDINTNKHYKFKIKEFFEKCGGRSIGEINYKTNGTISKREDYWEIEFDYDSDIVENVKKLPKRRYNPDTKTWIVPLSEEISIKNFAKENRFFIEEEGRNDLNNMHLASFPRKEIPNGITFCEGRLAKTKDNYFNKEFWWCFNNKCFNNCESTHTSNEWEKYTLLDFLTILEFDLSDGNRLGDYIEKGKYYQFISLINRFNRLLDKLYCNECKTVLYPVEDSHFAYYRVVRFNCTNSKCSKYGEEIYLHHCLNSKCNSIIDSRESKKCENGLYICSNTECGCCCSHSMLSRRLSNLEQTGGYIHPQLQLAVNKKLGHLERGKHFCYNCGNAMESVGNEVYQCNLCNITYSLSANNFDRSNIYLESEGTDFLIGISDIDFTDD